MAKILNQHITENFAIYNADCLEAIKSVPDKSIGFSIFSPPFVDLFCYSSSERDFGNSKSYSDFFVLFDQLAKELCRVMMPGRLVTVHCIDIPAMKERDGYIGLKDFPGDIIRSFQKAGFVYHARTVIWKDPLIEATRTKAIGLMHKQLCKDSTRCRMGLPDYLVTFRSPGENQTPVSQGEGFQDYIGADKISELSGNRSHNIWRAYASPVWMDIRQTNVISHKCAREEADEKHICPLQLDVIERCVLLWSNPDEIVLTPFMGVGSECYGAVVNGRRAVGFELKESYYHQAAKNLSASNAKKTQEELIAA
jgi:DNA modification methylase